MVSTPGKAWQRAIWAARCLSTAAGFAIVILEASWVWQVGSPADPTLYWGGVITASAAIACSAWHPPTAAVVLLLSIVFGLGIGDLSLAEFTIFPVFISCFVAMTLARAVVIAVSSGVLIGLGHAAGGSSQQVVLIIVLGTVGALGGLALRRSWQSACDRVQMQQRFQHTLKELRREERTALARELHDLIGHNLASISLHIEALDGADDPEELTVGMAAIRRHTKDAVADLRRMVLLLREEVPASQAMTKANSLEVLRRAVAALEQAGFEVDVDVGTTLRMLSVRQDAFVRYLLLEATTNVLRHAQRGTLCEVKARVRPDGKALQMSVRNAAAGASPGGGHGLQGIRERASQVGGQIHAGLEGADWVLTAHLPVLRDQIA